MTLKILSLSLSLNRVMSVLMCDTSSNSFSNVSVYLHELVRRLAIVESLNPEGIAPRAFKTSARLVCFTVWRNLDQRSRPLRGVMEGSGEKEREREVGGGEIGPPYLLETQHEMASHLLRVAI